MENNDDPRSLISAEAADIRFGLSPTLWKIIALGIAVFGVVLLSANLEPEWRWRSPLWYANLSGVGGGLAVFLGSVLLLIQPFRKRSEYLVVAACAFIASGLSGIFGIFVNDVPVSLWFDTQSILLGAVLLCGFWIPESVVRKYLTSKRPVLVSVGIAVALSGWFILEGRELLPLDIESHPVLMTMKSLKLAGGILLLAVLPRIAAVIPATERAMLFAVTLFLGLGAVTFPFVRIWGLEWWLVQLARCAPLLLAIRYALVTFTSSQRALFESEERFKALFNAAPVGIGIIANRNNAYQQANPALCRITGFTEAELSTTHLKSLMLPEDVHSSFELRNKLFRGEVPDYRVTRKYFTKGGGVAWVKVRGTLIQRGNGSAQEFRIVEDVTAEKIANDKVSTLVQELTRVNAELQKFTSVASHDLKSPLNTVSSYVQLISRRVSAIEDPDLRQFVKFAVDGCSRMRDLIDDLLSYASISRSAHQFTSVDCNTVLDEVFSSLDAEIKESGAKITKPVLPAVSGDKHQLSQLFQNLVGNAIKYRGKERPIVELKAEERKDDWLFSVSDNGIGFEMKYAEKVFDEFQRLRSQAEYSGTGLGLPICKSIVSRHGGKIWVESSPGKGSTFFFTLPKFLGDSALPVEQPSMAEEAGRGD